MGLEAATHIDDLVSTNPAGTDDRTTADDHLRLIKAVLLTDFGTITEPITAIPAEINALHNLSAEVVMVTDASGYTTTSAVTTTELALLAGYTGAIPEVGTVQDWTAQQNFVAATLSDAASIAWDLDSEQVAKVTLTANRTLANPTNMKDGGTYILRIIQDATGGRTLAYGTAYLFPSGTAPVLSTDANAIDVLSCVSDGTNMYCNLLKGFA